jgi:uncharacterized membrane-anchored protein YhcB (DUF1043 family)
MSFSEYVILVFALLMLIGWLVGITRIVGGIVDMALGVNQRPREKSRKEKELEEVQALLAELKQEREERERRSRPVRLNDLLRDIDRLVEQAKPPKRSRGWYERQKSSASGNSDGS